MNALLRKLRIYGAFAANVPKMMMAYNVWFWVELAGQIMMMIIFVFFWRAVYSNTDSVGGMNAQQTLNYILLAQIIAPLMRWSLILDFGGMIREGQIAIEMTRPVDFQLRFYVEASTSWFIALIRSAIPLALVAWIFFDLQLPTDPLVWLGFAVTIFLGNAVLFLFDWTFGTLAFYTTEAWGLHILREGIATFFSGALVPLTMLPAWIGKVAAALPFGQALHVPLSVLTGTLPMNQIAYVWGGQLIWIAGLLILSRVSFRVAARKVTVQGG